MKYPLNMQANSFINFMLAFLTILHEKLHFLKFLQVSRLEELDDEYELEL